VKINYMFGYSDVQISIERGQKYNYICNLEEFLRGLDVIHPLADYPCFSTYGICRDSRLRSFD
jgi:hypothetical protein